MIFATFENHFLRINPKKLDDRVIHENDGMFPSNCQSWVTKTGSWITLWSFFGELSSENVFQKLQKSLKLEHLQKIVSLETRLRWSQMGIRRLQHDLGRIQDIIFRWALLLFIKWSALKIVISNRLQKNVRKRPTCTHLYTPQTSNVR